MLATPPRDCGLELMLLGGFDVRLKGHPVAGMAYNKMRALLAYLAVEREQDHKREVLAELLWGSNDPITARGNLRRTLSDLRRVLDSPTEAALFAVGRQSIRFIPNGYIDALDFNADPGSTEGRGVDLSHEERVVALYRGEFLSGLSLPDCVMFENWLQMQRETMHRRALALLEQLSNHHEQSGDYSRALKFALRHTELEPWDEEGHCRVIRLYQLNGQSGAALVQYEACCSLLKNELGTLPSESTRQLAEHIRSGKSGLPVPAAAPAPTSIAANRSGDQPDWPPRPPTQEAASAPAQWLTFFGQPCLLGIEGVAALPFKHRNSFLLLSFLLAHPGRISQHESLADLFWPELDASAARTHLRMVLDDLSSGLKQLGLAHALETQREWLSLRLPENVWSDQMLLPALQARQVRAALWIDLAKAHLGRNPLWLGLGDTHTTPDFQEWLGVQRSFLEGALRSPELDCLAVLRVEIESTQATDDERETWRRIQSLEEGIVREARAHGGVLVEIDATGFTLVFGLDSLHGGYRSLSLRAASSLNLLLAPKYLVRMGVLAGRVLIERGSVLRASGQRVRLVEQMAQHAKPGEILADESYRDLATTFSSTAPSTQRFRGVAKDVVLFGSLIAKLPSFLLPPVGENTPFFGREALIANFGVRWQLACNGLTQRHCLEGEPGIGKTRTTYEFAKRLQMSGTAVFWLGGRSESFEASWSALHELLMRLLSTCGSDWPERLDRFLAQWGTVMGSEHRAVLLHFLATQGVMNGERGVFTEVIGLLLCGGSAAALVVIDDAQWIDAASSAVLHDIGLAPTATYFILTRRPNYTSGVLLEHCDTQRLAPLDDGSAQAILGALPDADLLEKKQFRRIIAAAHGLPIYLLAGTASNGATFAEYLQGMINGLGDAMEVMKVAALFGIQFELDDLRSLVPSIDVDLAVEQADACRLIVPRGQHTWAFFHPLLHSHLRGLLEASKRLLLAPRVAQVLQERGELARAAALFEEGGEPGLALAAYCRAAYAALDQEDAVAASPLFAHIARLGYGEGEAGQWARMRHARVLVIKDGYGSNSVNIISREVRQTLHTLRAGDELAFTTISYAYLGAPNERPEAGLTYAAEMARLALTPIQLQTASWARANSLFWLGHFIESAPLLSQALTAATVLPFNERIRYFPSDPLVIGHGQMAWMCWFMGDDAGANTHIDQSMTYARASRLSQDKAIAPCLKAVLHLYEGDIAKLAVHAEEAWLVADGEDYLLWKTFSSLLLAIARAHAGVSPKISELRAYEKSLKLAYPSGLNTGRWMAALALQASGHNFLALQVINIALADAFNQEHQFCLMELWRLKEKTLTALPLSHRSGIKAARTQAIACARASGAQGWLRRWYPEEVASPLREVAAS